MNFQKRSKQLFAKIITTSFLFMSLLLASILQVAAELHHFEINVPKEVHAGKPVEISIIAKNKEGKTDKSALSLNVHMDCRAEKFEQEVTLKSGKAKVTFTPNYNKSYNLVVIASKGLPKEILGMASVEVKP